MEEEQRGADSVAWMQEGEGDSSSQTGELLGRIWEAGTVLWSRLEHRDIPGVSRVTQWLWISRKKKSVEEFLSQL